MSKGNIILLNGASSAGKSCILRAIQDIMEVPYLNAGIDKFIWMLPNRFLDRPLWDEVMGLEDRAGPIGHLLIKGMHEAIAALSSCGNHVVADHVMVDLSWLTDCANLFSDFPAYFIGVRCPVSVLEEREKNRKDRTFGQARLQDAVVHTHALYDLEVDTSILSPLECAEQIRDFVQSGGPPYALRMLKKQLGQPYV